jgi:hypothetical protein
VSLAELFFARERLRRRARDVVRARQARRRSPLVFEPLEGRFLLSSDVLILSDPLLASTLPALVEPLEPTPNPSLAAVSPVNVDEFVDVTLSGLVLDRATGTFDAQATITNVSADETLQAPMRLVVTSIASAGAVTLANADGQTEEGDAFVEVSLPDGGLVPGASVDDILLKFANPLRVHFTFTTSVEAVPEPGGDRTPPVIAATLANDTGADTGDGLTADPSVEGSVIDSSPIVSFRAGLDDTPAGDFADILDRLGPGGTFTLDAAELAVIAGGLLGEGAHTLHLVATDGAGNPSGIFDVPFTLDTIAPSEPVFDLAPASDTSPVGDQQTTLDSVTLVGQTEPGALVTLVDTGDETTAGGGGDFAFGGVALALGANPFTALATDLAGNESEFTLTLTRLEAEETPFTLAEHTPLDGADGVGVGVRPKIVFSEAVDPATLTGTTFLATAAGTALPTTVVVDPSGLFARLFFGGPMPGGAAVQVTVDGSAILAAADGVPLDADGDGAPGGVLTFDFTTLSTVALPGTELSGRLADAGPDLVPLTADDTLPGPDDHVGTPDDVILTPIVGARIFVRGLEDEFVLTGADGAFHFDAVPGGPVTLALRGETGAAPPGFTYPELTADLQVTVGIDNTIGTVYMPRLASEVVQTVDTSATTVLTLPPGGAPGLTEEQRQQFTLEIAAGGLLGPDGQPVATAQVVMSVVPTGTLAPFLPPTLPEPTFAFTTQLRGATDLASPFRATFPSVSGAPLGTEFSVLSFDPVTGHLVQDGTATVVAAGGSPLQATGGAAGLLAQQAALDGEGEAVITWTPSPFSALAACFHVLMPNISSVSSSDCQPSVPATQFVFPAFLDDETLKDYLFFSDSDTATLHFENAAESLDPSSDPCSLVNQKASPLKVEIRLEQPEEMPFIEPRGLADEVFFLYPQEERDVPIRLRRLLEDFNIDPAMESRLLGATLSLRGTTVNPQTGQEVVVFEQSQFLYRLFDVADAQHIDETLDFERTLADGTGGLVRDKPLRLVMPDEARPTFAVPGGPFRFGNVGDTTVVQFDPATAGEHVASLELASSNGPVGDIDLHGTAAARQTVAFSRAAFRDALALVVDQVAGLLTARRAFILSFPDSDGDLERSDDPAFDGIVNTMYDMAVSGAEDIAYGFDVFVDSAMTFVDGTAGSMHVTPFSTIGGGPDFALDPDAIGVSPFADFKRNAFNEMVADRENTSLPGEKFLFSRLVNNSPTDPDPVGYQGAALDIDLLTAGWSVVDPDEIHTRFANRIANTMAHELGHNLGAIHTRSASQAYIAGDLMGAGGGTQMVFTFSDRHRALVKMALGVPATDAEFQATFDYYVQTVPLETDLPFAPEALTLPGRPLVDAPMLEVFAAPVVVGQPVPEPVRTVDFGSIVADGAGGQSITTTLHLFSDGDQDLTISGISLLGGTAGFSIEGVGALPIGLPPLDPDNLQPDLSTRAITLRFDPSGAGAAADVLRIVSNRDGGLPIEIPLSALGVSPVGDLVLEVPNNNLGGARLGGPAAADPDLATIRNAGAGPLTVTGITVSGGEGQFTVTGLPAGLGPGNPLVLAAGESFTFGAAFDAERIGLQRARIEIASSDPDGPVRSQTVTGTGLADSGSALDYGHDFVAVQAGDGPILRKVSDGGGHWSFFLASGVAFRHAEFDPVSGLIADTVDVTSGTGETVVGVPVFRASTESDTDGDGLPDDVEFAIGSAPGEVDTDDDGADDFTEIAAGGNPLDGVAGPTGVIGALQLDGEAWDIATVGPVAYVATGNHGLAIVDISEPGQPILLGSRDLTGSNVSVAVDGARGLAAVASHFVEPGLHIVDVSDPAHPVTQRTVALPDGARHVEVLDGVAFVASGTAVVAIELVSGEVLQTLDLGGALTGLAREGETLFAMDQAGTLTAVDISGVQMVALDTLAVADGGGEVFGGGGIAYLASQGARGGFATVDVSDPGDLALISNSDVAAGFRPDQAVAADGSAHALVIGNVPDPNNPFLSIDVVDVADVSDPADTDAFLARFVLPEFPLGITLASGVAFIADGSADLLVIGYESADVAGEAPDVSISALVDDLDPAAPGIQVAPDSRIHLLVEATDDVLVRGVEILVNGQPVGSDTSFPYEALLTASASAGSMTVQARATDIGGNVALSNALVFQVASDTVAPTIVAIDPADGATAPEGLQQVTARFSEALDPASVSASTFRVVAGGQTVAPLGVDLLSEGRLVQLRFAGLAAGNYQLVIDAEAVTDLSGNALGTVDVVSDFTLTGEAVTWINPAGGFWDDPANWSGGVLPGPDDNVVIDVPGDVTITHRTGLTVINRLISRESLALTGGTLDVTTTVQVDGAFTLSFTQGTGPTLRHATVLPGAGGQDIVITDSVTLDDVTLAADLTVANLGTANVRNGLTLDGRLTLASDGSPTMLIFDSDQTLGGTGEVFFGGTGNDNSVDVNGILTIGSGITIRGSQSGGVGTTFTNETIVLEGTVLAETAGETIGVGGNGWELRGLVRATNGGRLELDGTFTFEDAGTFSSASGGAVVLVGTLDNTGRTLALTAATGSLQVDGGTVQGGRVETTGGAALVAQFEMILDGVTLGSDFSVPDGGLITVTNGLILDDITVTLVDGTVPFIGPRIRFATTETLGGAGDVVFGGTGDAGSVVSTTGATLTIGPGITIHGPRGGSVGVLGSLVNQGTISAEVNALEITVSGTSVTNAGALQALNGGQILLSGTFANTAEVIVGAGSQFRILGSGTYLQSAGETTLAGGTLWADTVSLQGGVLSGFGTVRGTVSVSLINAALVDLGAPTGTLQVNGAYQQTAAGALNVGLGGTAAGQFDRLQVTGAATLGGTLNVSLVGGFLPAVGNTFEILVFASRTSDFATVTGLSLPNGNTLQYSPEATRARLITTV